jgi:flagellar hook-associated protein 3 FlgL
MSERITNAMMANTLLADLQNLTDSLSHSQAELSSGKKILQPSDDPFGTSRALAFRADLASNAQFQTNANDGAAWLNAADASLGGLSELIQRARDLTVQGANTTNGAAANASIAAEIDQIIESVKTQGNAQYAGQYIFSGTLTTTQPYTPGGADTYSGNTGVVARAVGPGVNVPVNVDGGSVIGDGSTPGTLLYTLRQVSADLKANNISALGSTDLQGIDAAVDNVNTVRATVGARADRIETALSRLQALQQSSTEQLSNTEDADMAQVITTYSQQQAVYQAALKAGAQIIQPSLMDFLH